MVPKNRIKLTRFEKIMFSFLTFFILMYGILILNILN